MILSRILFSLLGLCLIYLIYQIAVLDNVHLYYWSIPLVFSAIFVFAFKPQIDYMFHNLTKPKLEDELKGVLNRFDPFYQQIQGKTKEKFDERLHAYLVSKDFISKTDNTKISEDVKALIAAQHIKLSLGQDKYLYPEYERIALYPHPFLSPTYEELAHASETEHEDGIILLSLDQAMKSITKPGSFFNLSLYEYAQAFIRLHFSSFNYETEIDENTLLACGFWNKEDIAKQVGIPEINYSAAGIVLFFERPQKLQQANPELYSRYQKILNIDPLRA